MTVTDLTDFITAQTPIISGIFLAGFGGYFGIALVRGAIVRWGHKLKRQV